MRLSLSERPDQKRIHPANQNPGVQGCDFRTAGMWGAHTLGQRRHRCGWGNLSRLTPVCQWAYHRRAHQIRAGPAPRETSSVRGTRTQFDSAARSVTNTPSPTLSPGWVTTWSPGTRPDSTSANTVLRWPMSTTRVAALSPSITKTAQSSP